MKQKGFAKILILIIGVLAVVGVVGYYLYNQSSTSSSPAFVSTSTPLAQTGAQIYKNSEYNFEFQYDKDLKVTFTGIKDTTNTTDITVYKSKYYLVELVDTKSVNQSQKFTIDVEEEEKCFTPYEGTAEITKKITIAGQPADYYEFTGSGNSLVLRSCIAKNEYMYEFVAGLDYDADQTTKDRVRSNINQILSTFKFTN